MDIFFILISQIAQEEKLESLVADMVDDVYIRFILNNPDYDNFLIRYTHNNKTFYAIEPAFYYEIREELKVVMLRNYNLADENSRFEGILKYNTYKFEFQNYMFMFIICFYFRYGIVQQDFEIFQEKKHKCDNFC